FLEPAAELLVSDAQLVVVAPQVLSPCDRSVSPNGIGFGKGRLRPRLWATDGANLLEGRRLRPAVLTEGLKKLPFRSPAQVFSQGWTRRGGDVTHEEQSVGAQPEPRVVPIQDRQREWPATIDPHNIQVSGRQEREDALRVADAEIDAICGNLARPTAVADFLG